MAKVKYDDSAIQVLEGLEAVRKRPGMYIGSTDVRGLHHLVYEIIDNAVDEVLAGHGSRIEVSIEEGNSIRVRDYGRGIPCGEFSKGVSTVEVIFTVLHAGGKFGQGGYPTSGGLHGVGSAVVNALSSAMEVRVFRDGYEHEIKFGDGGKVRSKLEKVRKSKEVGTEVWFKPDGKIFSVEEYKFDLLSERLRETAFLMSGLEVVLRDCRVGKEKEEVYKYDEGLGEFVDFLVEKKEKIHDVKMFRGVSNEIEVEFAFVYTEDYSETLLSFVNNVRTKDGGTHETGARTAITRVVNEYARRVGLLKERDKNLEGGDVREGMSAILSIRVPENLLQFEGQTKSKLGTSEARSSVDVVISENLSHFLNENVKIAEILVGKAIKSAKVREEARKARDNARRGVSSKRKDVLLGGKLTPATSKDVLKNELYIVEGDSAAGTAKQGRDRRHQAILPLRGKVLNTETSKIDRIMSNEEIRTIIYAVGAGFGVDFRMEDRKYDKVIIMTDADKDGSHIQALLLTFFYRYMQELVEEGKVYVALPPLYKVSKGRGKNEQVEYAWDEGELGEASKKLGKGYDVTRFKGLGEMSAGQLWETTMNPESRTLLQVTLEDLAMADRQVSILMGDNVNLRREWIEKNVDFSINE